MSRRDPQVRLKHMLDYAREAVDMAKGKKQRLALSLKVISRLDLFSPLFLFRCKRSRRRPQWQRADNGDQRSLVVGGSAG